MVGFGMRWSLKRDIWLLRFIADNGLLLARKIGGIYGNESIHFDGYGFKTVTHNNGILIPQHLYKQWNYEP